MSIQAATSPASRHLYTITDEHEAACFKQPTLALQISYQLDPGIRRKHRPNEDTLLVVQEMMPARSRFLPPKPFVLLSVADGMGGLGHGQEASQLATRSLVEYIENSIKAQESTPQALMPLLIAGIQYANRAVYERNQERQTQMGTTMTAVLISEAMAYVVHAGDSRLYSYRKSIGLVQLTHDHSLVAMLVNAGIIAPEDIYSHPQRNQIYRSLGADATLKADAFAIPLVADDILLLCSDGLWEMVRDRQIADILTAPLSKQQNIADVLIQAALAGGGVDNISAIVARAVDRTELARL